MRRPGNELWVRREAPENGKPGPESQHQHGQEEAQERGAVERRLGKETNRRVDQIGSGGARRKARGNTRVHAAKGSHPER